MGPNLTSFGGVIAPGSYGILTLNGSHTVGHGVRFTTLIVRGSARIDECTGGRIICESGRIHCHGPMQVASVTGTGHLRTGGTVRCGFVDFAGMLDGFGDLHCDADLRFIGALAGDRGITAARVDIGGVLDTRTVNADTVDIKPFESRIFARHGITHFSRGSVIDDITGSKVAVSRVRCRQIRAANVIIAEHCDIGQVVYRDECRLAPSSRVGHISREWPNYLRDRRRA